MHIFEVMNSATFVDKDLCISIKAQKRTMKNIIVLCLSIFLLFLHCSKNEDFEKNSTKQNKSEIKKIENSKYHTKLDTLVIKTENDITLHLEKNKFNKIVDSHPEFFDDIMQSPDISYAVNSSDFGSEARKDNYFILYAHFLKQKNGSVKHTEQRDKLIKIYSNINSIFGTIAYGGTYFAHQGPRILGYAEYSIYLHSIDNEANLKDPYDLSKQKSLYIQSLRQLIKDENKVDPEASHSQKIERSKKMNELVDEINHLITNIFYLQSAQRFQYEHY